MMGYLGWESLERDFERSTHYLLDSEGKLFSYHHHHHHHPHHHHQLLLGHELSLSTGSKCSGMESSLGDICIWHDLYNILCSIGHIIEKPMGMSTSSVRNNWKPLTYSLTNQQNLEKN